MDRDSSQAHSSIVGWIVVLFGLALRFVPNVYFELSSLLAFAFLGVWLFKRRSTTFGISTLVLVAVASFSVALGMRTFSPREFTETLLQARAERAAAQTPEAKMVRQRLADAMLMFRQNVRVGQRVLVSDETHDEHYIGGITGRLGAIVDVHSDRDVAVKLDSGTTLAAPLAKISPTGPDLAAIMNETRGFSQ